MFKFLDKFRTPGPSREDVEQKRKVPDKDTYDAAENMLRGEAMVNKFFSKHINDIVENARKAINDNQPYQSPFGKQSELHQRNIKPKTPLVLVPLHDYEIMKIIRLGWAIGEGTTQLPIEESGYTENQENETHYNNARILHDYYGFPKDKIFQLTGCVLE